MAGAARRSCRWRAMPSFRRYFRVVDDGARAVLMDAPPPHEDPRPFLAAAGMAGRGRASPRRTILARDLERGLLLLEDFGDARLRETLDARARAGGRALRARGRHARPSPRACRPCLASGRTVSTNGCEECCSFPTGMCPALGLDGRRGRLSCRLARRCWSRSRDDGLGPVTVLRDYHAENIMLVAGRDGHRPFRPARFPGRAGRPSRLRSRLAARRMRGATSTPAIERAMLERYRNATGRRDCFRTRLLRRSARSATPGSSASSPGCGSATASAIIRNSSRACGACLERNLAHPALAPVRAWFDANVPADKRAAAWRVSRYRKPLALRPDPGAAVPEDGDGDGGGPRQAHAAADRDAAQAAGRGGRAGADRPLPRPAARRGRREGGGQRPLSRRRARSASQAIASTGIEIIISDERKQLLETGGGLVRRCR